MFRRTANLANVCLRLKVFVFCLLALGAAAAPARAQSSSDPVYVFHTTLGDISVQLYPDVAPQTVANFLRYVNAGAYNKSLIHRSVPGFIIQGGGYQVKSGTSITTIPANPPVVNEFHLSNTRGTIAMAKLGNDPNSATSQWFFNESDSNASNLDNQNGGFTVFGKVLDAAGLAVMDQIAGVPVPNPSPYNAPLNQIPLVNYQPAAGVQASNLVTISSITPSAHTHLLWNNTDGRVILWSIAADGTFTYQVYGPYTDGSTDTPWRAAALATGPDGLSHILWTNPDGKVILWTVDDSGTFTYAVYGPYQDGAPNTPWSAKALSVGADNVVHILWTNPDHRVILWNVDSTFNFTNALFGPYDDGAPNTFWNATAIATGPDNVTRLVWNNPDGRVILWNVNSAFGFTYHVYGPYNDGSPNTPWSASAVSVGPDSVTHLLWTNPDTRVILWNVDTSFGFTNALFGPYTDGAPNTPWNATALATGPDGLSHLLWTNPDNRVFVWGVDSTFAFTNTLYGPYTDGAPQNIWSATAISAAQ